MAAVELSCQREVAVTPSHGILVPPLAGSFELHHHDGGAEADPMTHPESVATVRSESEFGKSVATPTHCPALHSRSQLDPEGVRSDASSAE